MRSKMIDLVPRGRATHGSSERPLLVLAGVGPAQVVLTESAQTAWKEACAVVWLNQHPSTSGNALRTTAKNLRATRAIAVGSEAVYAVRESLPDMPIEGVFLHHELDFRFSNKVRQNRLLGAFSSCDRLWFDSTVAMDKACAHGSDRPHLLAPRPILYAQQVERTAAAFVAILTSHEQQSPAEERISQILQDAISQAGGRSEVCPADQLYTEDDMKLGRSWSDAVKSRVPRGISHAVLIGKGGHHFFAGAALLYQSVEVFAEATIENTAVARRLQLDEQRIARGAALAERVATAVRDHETAPESSGLSVPSASEFRTKFEAAAAKELPDWHEETVVDIEQHEFDLFFSTAAIENRNDGARPQRIRAMSQAFEEPGVPLVRMTSNLNLLRRRLHGAINLVRLGAEPRFGYGENSTAPMPLESRVALREGVRELRKCGLRFAWYVRDFHWLDPNSSVSQAGDGLDELRQAGLAELEDMRDLADIMYAPSREASRMFDELLRRSFDGETVIWKPLPPGIDSSNCLGAPRSHSAQHGALHVFYTGGLGGVYELRTAMKALADCDNEWQLHLTVRAEDEAVARQVTSHLPHHRVQIECGEFANLPATEGTAVGLALLDSEYGFASFPLKVLSYLEKRIPALVYRNSSPAGLIETYRAGAVVDRAAESVTTALNTFESNFGLDEADWTNLHEKESWKARAAVVRKDLLEQPNARLTDNISYQTPGREAAS